MFRGNVWGFLGFRRVLQLSAIDDQISENLSEEPLALPDVSFWDSKTVNILAWSRILYKKVLGWILILFVCALSMMCLVMFVSTMSG